MTKTLLAVTVLALGLGHAPLARAQEVARHFLLGRSRWSLEGRLRLPAGEARSARGLSKLPPKAPDAQPLPRFLAVSVKPSPPNERATPWTRDNGYWAGRKNGVYRIIAYGYGIGLHDIVGLPAWAKSNLYDFVARMPPDTSVAQFRLMMQALLADRFQMKAHIEMRPEDASILTAGEPGPDRVPASPSCVPTPKHPRGAFGTVGMSATIWKMAGCAVSMAEIAHYFTVFTSPNRVSDASGVTALYDVNVTIDIPPMPADATFQAKQQNRRLALKRAFQKQLGLDLDLTRTEKTPMPVLVIDHIEPPTAN
jgi:uncharacterized protein (TIGR03435 family)